MTTIKKPLFIFEMANNHQGEITHGIAIIEALKKVCIPFETQFDFGIKFQYRQLDTFIHPDYIHRDDIKNVKRFQDTRLDKTAFAQLVHKAKSLGFYTLCTPFDEESVDVIVEQEYDFIKIASCSFGDWPLLEKVALAGKPIIASAAGAELEGIRCVVDFFKHRGIDISLMHCVAEYPTNNENLQMNQIDLYKKEFPELKIGFSTHEAPDNLLPIRVAIAKGASIFEKHIGLETERIKLNDYSANPSQVEKWLEAAQETYQICGLTHGRYMSTQKEIDDLQALRRGAFAKRVIKKGEKIQKEDLFFAFPCERNQLVAHDFSKYNTFYSTKDIPFNAPIMKDEIQKQDNREMIQNTLTKIVNILKKSGVIIPINSICEISHHYGIENYNQTGVAIITCVNREYCKKLLVLLPGQKHPTHYHVVKEETFNILYGDLIVKLGDKEFTVKPGESSVVERNNKHSFSSNTGCVFEEISTKHYVDDSYYDEDDFVNPRKTVVYITKKMIDEE